jgi:hypothetical protein
MIPYDFDVRILVAVGCGSPVVKLNKTIAIINLENKYVQLLR